VEKVEELVSMGQEELEVREEWVVQAILGQLRPTILTLMLRVVHILQVKRIIITILEECLGLQDQEGGMVQLSQPVEKMHKMDVINL
jgi:hypothetical protein